MNRALMSIGLALFATVLAGPAFSQVIVGPDGVIRRAPGAPGGPAEADPPIAVPANDADDDTQPGPKKFGRLGIVPDPVPEAVAAQLGITDQSGVLVAGVQKDSPAEKAGLARLDVLVKIDDQVLYSTEQLQKLIAGKKPGTAVTVTFFHAGKSQTAKVELAGTNSMTWQMAPSRVIYMEPAQGWMHGEGFGGAAAGSTGPASKPDGPNARTGRGVINIRGIDGKDVVIRVDDLDGPQLIETLKKLEGKIPPEAIEQLKMMILMPVPAPPARGGPPIKLTPDQQAKLKKLGEMGMIPIPPGPDGMTPELIDMMWKMKDNPPWMQQQGKPGGILGGQPNNPLLVPVVIPGMGQPGGQAVACSTTSSDNFRAAWVKSAGQPAKVSLFNKEGEAIFTDATVEQLPGLIARHKLGDEAQQLLKQQPHLEAINLGGANGNPFAVPPATQP